MKADTFDRQLLFATLRIEAQSNVGSGFIFRHHWAEDRSGPFLITNKHVVAGTREGRLTFTLTDQSNETGGPSLGESTSATLGDNAWKWTGHPSANVDVAALPLAPVLNHLSEIGKTPYYRSIPPSMIPEQDSLEDLQAVEEVLFVGYPSGIYDQRNNLPIARNGITATPVFVDYEGKPIFLIDASVFHGSSGSPVFTWSPSTKIIRSLSGRNSVFFLGILSSA